VSLLHKNFNFYSYNFATCLEGALKIKELSYMHCEGILSGELKHGPLAMVDDKKCMVMIICKDNVYKVLIFFIPHKFCTHTDIQAFFLQKSLNALEQVLARGGRPIVIADRSVPDSDLVAIKDVLRVPKTVDCLQNVSISAYKNEIFQPFRIIFLAFDRDPATNAQLSHCRAERTRCE
jgi:glucosamine--fructose-6-phosphate aminotransferase (isomerizing)